VDVGTRSVSVWENEDFLSSWSSGVSGEVAVGQTAFMQHSHSENCTWLVGKATLWQNMPRCDASADIWSWCYCAQVRSCFHTLHVCLQVF